MLFCIFTFLNFQTLKDYARHASEVQSFHVFTSIVETTEQFAAGSSEPTNVRREALIAALKNIVRANPQSALIITGLGEPIKLFNQVPLPDRTHVASVAAASTIGERPVVSTDGNLVLYTSRVQGLDLAFAVLPVSSGILLDFLKDQEADLYLLMTIASLLISGVIYYFLNKKLTAIRKDERRFKDFTGASADYFWEMDEHCRFAFLSDRFEAVTGVPPGQLLGKTRQETGNPGISEADWEEHLYNLANRLPFRGFRHPRTRPDGVVVWLSINGNPYFDDDGAFLGYRGVGTDISELVERERNLKDARNRARAADKAKSQFLANMSHEIRTPMNGVIGMAGLLLDTSLNERQRHYAQTIRESGENLMQIINDVLDFSKMDAGQMELETSAFTIQPIIEGVVEILSPRALAKSIDLLCFIPVELQRTYLGDPGRLRQVITNLVGNAVKFTDKGAVTINVSEAGDPGFLRFEVTDTGIGIPEEKIGELFKSFSQVDATTTRRFEGTGLGLAISRQLVELMGGRIGVDSVYGKGSTFWFEVPLGKGAESGRPAMRTQAGVNLSNLAVLIVEDITANRTLFAQMLQNWSIKTEAVASIDEGLNALRRTKFDLVFLDMRLSEKAGEDFLDAVRLMRSRGATKIIWAAPGNHNHARQHIGQLLADRILPKPIHQSALYNAIVDLTHDINDVMTNRGKEPRPAIETEQQSARRLRVLVAEDNAINQQVAAGFLAKLGHRVDVAANGLEAVRAVQSLPYDLVFMDLQMPEMDGLEATAAIRNLPGDKRNVCIVAMTANAMAGDEERCLAAGMDDYISKPILTKNLSAIIGKHFPDDPANGGPSEGETQGVASVIDAAIIESLEAQLGQDTFNSLLEQFMADAAARLEAIKEGMAADALGQVAREAHSVKGAASSLGLRLIAEQAGRLEEVAKNNDTAACPALVLRLDTAYHSAIAWIEHRPAA